MCVIKPRLCNLNCEADCSMSLPSNRALSLLSRANSLFLSRNAEWNCSGTAEKRSLGNMQRLFFLHFRNSLFCFRSLHVHSQFLIKSDFHLNIGEDRDGDQKKSRCAKLNWIPRKEISSVSMEIPKFAMSHLRLVVGCREPAGLTSKGEKVKFLNGAEIYSCERATTRKCRVSSSMNLHSWLFA